MEGGALSSVSRFIPTDTPSCEDKERHAERSRMKFSGVSEVGDGAGTVCCRRPQPWFKFQLRSLSGADWFFFRFTLFKWVSLIERFLFKRSAKIESRSLESDRKFAYWFAYQWSIQFLMRSLIQAASEGFL